MSAHCVQGCKCRCYSCQGVCISVTKLLRIWSWQKCHQVIKRRNCHFPLTISIIIFSFMLVLSIANIPPWLLWPPAAEMWRLLHFSEAKVRWNAAWPFRLKWPCKPSNMYPNQDHLWEWLGSDLGEKKIDFCLLSGCTFRLLNSPIVLWLLYVYSRQLVCHCTCFQSHVGVFLQI